MKFQDVGSNSTLTDSLYDAYLLYPRSPCLHQCLGHDIHMKRNHPDKKREWFKQQRRANRKRRQIEPVMQSRLHATAQTNLSLYVAYTHAPLPLWLVAVSRFSGSAVSKVIKKKDWFRSLRWTFTHASLPLGLLDFSRFSGSAVSRLKKKTIKFRSLNLCFGEHFPFQPHTAL